MIDFLSLLTAVPSISANFSGSTSDPYKKKKEQLTGAMMDTQNPLYKQLYGQYKDQNMQNLSGGLAEVQNQNRLANRMGRTPLFDQERGGETLFRNLMKGYQDSGATANTQTLGTLQNQFNNYSKMTPTTARANSQKLSGYQGISDLLRAFLS